MRLLQFDPIPVTRWNGAAATRGFCCDEPCCLFGRVAAVGREVTSEAELHEALTRPDIFWWGASP